MSYTLSPPSHFRIFTPAHGLSQTIVPVVIPSHDSGDLVTTDKGPDDDLEEAIDILEMTTSTSALHKLRKALLVSLCVIKLRDSDKDIDRSVYARQKKGDLVNIDSIQP